MVTAPAPLSIVPADAEAMLFNAPRAAVPTGDPVFAQPCRTRLRAGIYDII
jgi:hypothetical protein